MKRYKTTVYVPKRDLLELNRILASESDRFGFGEDVIFAATAEFSNGYFADIKLVSGDPPYVDPVLFDKHGHEVAAGEPDAERFEGIYTWSLLSAEYQVEVKARG